jgi:hypothetical protein
MNSERASSRPDDDDTMGVLRPAFPQSLLSHRALGIVLLVATFAAAAYLQSVQFIRAPWMLGDMAYHRGVAYTMQGGDFQGQGPYEGLITYYGGLFSMTVAILSRVTGSTFDAVVSVLSWPGALLLPGCLLLLARRIWGSDWSSIAVFVLIGTFAAPLTTDRTQLWVDGVLPSASSFWPLYPRDIAIAFLCLGLWALLSPRRRTRIVGLGLVAGAMVLVHAQISVLFAWFLLVYGIGRSATARSAAPLLELVASGLIASLLAAWWWIPRVAAYATSGGLLLADYPGRIPLRIDVPGYLVAFGSAGILAVLAAVALPRLLRWRPELRVFVAWLVALLPLILVDRLVPSADLFTERRVWLVGSIGLVGLAAGGLAYVARALPGWALPVLVAVAVVVPSAPATLATDRRVEQAASNAWTPGDAGMLWAIDVPSWNASMEQLNGLVREQGHATVLATDASAVWAWSFSGAQVFSAWLPGPVKLGFDPEALTGTGYLERVRQLQDAYDQGRAGTCGLARKADIPVALVELQDGLVVDYDRSLGSPYRVSPQDRSLESIDRVVAPGVSYQDRSAYDRLRLAPGATVRIPWVGPDIRRIGLLVDELGAPSEPLLSIDAGTARAAYQGGGRTVPHWVYLDVQGIDDGITITASRSVAVLRLVGLVPPSGLDGAPSTGFMVVTTDRLCSGS